MIDVTHVISDSNIGGAGHHLLTLLDASDRKEFDLSVILPLNSKLATLVRDRGIPVSEMPLLAERSFSWDATRILNRLYQRIKPDIIHTHAVLSARLAARIYKKCKIVYTRHSVFPPKRRLLAGYINDKLCDAVIAVSPAARDNLIAEGVKPEKITTILNGMPRVAQAAPGGALTREALGLPPDAFVLAHIARLTPVKGHDYVLDAAKRCPDVYFLIAGDGELSEQLARRVQAEGLKNVRLLGFVKDTDSLMNLMDAQINASYGTEATSLALVSGMSLGKPAIATDYGGNPYVIQHEQNGLIVPHKDAEALAQAITRLQTDTALYQGLRAGALSRYEASFTDTEMARQTQDLYRKMLL